MIDASLLGTAAVAFAVAAAFRGRDFLRLRWTPDRHTWAALGIGLLPVVFSTVALGLDQESLAFEIVLWLGIFSFCGVFAPWAYVLFVEQGTPADLGVRRDRWLTSVMVSAGFGGGALFDMLSSTDISRYSTSHLVGTAVSLNVGGLFEAFLYCGLVHLRLRDAFGTLPAIFGSAAVYSVWHIGTELPLHPDSRSALFMLFVVGVLCHSLFATTYNLLAVWPIFFTAGVMHDFVLKLDLPDHIGTSFAWPAVGWALAIGIPLGLLAVSRRRVPNPAT